MPSVRQYRHDPSTALAIREAINKLALSPAETVKFINNESCIWTDTNDESVTIALTALKALYDRLRDELSSTQNTIDHPIEARHLLSFLVEAPDDTPRKIYRRFDQRQREKTKWTSLAIADRTSPADAKRPPVPSIVPRLDGHDFREISGLSEASSGTSSGNDEQDEEAGVHPDPRDVGIDFGSVGSGSDDFYAGQPAKNYGDSDSPISTPTPKLPEKLKSLGSHRRSDTRQTPKNASLAVSPRKETPRKSIIQVSKSIQTDFDVVLKSETADVGVSAHLASTRGSSSVTTSVGLSSSERNSSNTTATSSSTVPTSSLSAGEVPLSKVAKLGARQQIRLIPVRPDGSIRSHPDDSSSPKTFGVRLIESIDEVSIIENFRHQHPVVITGSKHGNAPGKVDSFSSLSNFASMAPLKTSTPLSKPPINRPASATGYPSSGEVQQSMTRWASDETSQRLIFAPDKSDPMSDLSFSPPRRPLVEEVYDEVPSQPSSGQRNVLSGDALSLEADLDEEESTLNQISPLPSGGD